MNEEPILAERWWYDEKEGVVKHQYLVAKYRRGSNGTDHYEFHDSDDNSVITLPAYSIGIVVYDNTIFFLSRDNRNRALRKLYTLYGNRFLKAMSDANKYSEIRKTLFCATVGDNVTEV